MIRPSEGGNASGARTELRGTPAAPGIRVGRAVLLADHRDGPEPSVPADPATEIGRWRSARERVGRDLLELAKLLEAEGRAAEAEILRAQQLIVTDPELEAAVEARIQAGEPAERAVQAAADGYAELLSSIDDPYLRERAADIRDVGRQLVGALRGEGAGQPLEGEPGAVVLVGADMGPAELARWRHRVAGIVTETGGATAHVAILARSLGLPAVAGVSGLLAAVRAGVEVLVDGDRGRVIVDPTPDERARAEAARAAEEAERARLAPLRDLPAVTRDGFRVELAINIGHPDEIAAAEPFGPEGVGLFRTEFLFLDRVSPPGEEEQYRAYLAAVRALRGRRLVLRTLDVGADKRLAFVDWPEELNPSLGWRGARIGLDRPDLLESQLRAALRAAAHGPVAVMFPMVSVREEVRRLRAMLDEVAAALAAEGREAGRVEVGIMVETPAAALGARALAPELDFFSIGTNDLTQYVLAVDRTAERVQHLYDPLHPAVLRLIAETAAAARDAGIWCGVCGELGGEPLAVPFLVGAGVTELSMAAPRLLRVKEVVRALDRAAAERLAQEVLTLGDGREVRERLRRFLAGLGVPGFEA